MTDANYSKSKEESYSISNEDQSPQKTGKAGKNSIDENFKGIIESLENKLMEEVKTRIENQNDIRRFCETKGQELKASLSHEFDVQTKDTDTKINDMIVKINKTEKQEETNVSIDHIKLENAKSVNADLPKLLSHQKRLSDFIKDGFKEIKQQRNDNLGDCFTILDKFEHKIYTDKGDFEALAFEELAGIKSALCDERELRIENDNKLIEGINKLFENLSKTDETPKSS